MKSSLTVSAVLIAALGGITPSFALDLNCLNRSSSFRGVRITIPQDELGISVSCAGDYNGDGIDDLLIGVGVSGNTGLGKTYVVFGREGLGGTGPIDLTSFDGTDGFVFDATTISPPNRFGRAVSAAGNFNGVGNAILIGAPLADPNGNMNSGLSCVVYPDPDVRPDGTLDFSKLSGSGLFINGVDAGDQSGSAVAPIGDFNGDGFDDIFIGAPAADSSGTAYVVYGGISPATELNALDGTNGFRINGVNFDERNGASVSSAGDMNGDGYIDLLIGAPNAAPLGASGQCYVVFGGVGVGASGPVELNALDGSNGFTLSSILGADAALGRTVSSAGDLNGDGFGDIVVGAPGAADGASFVVFGREDIGSPSLITFLPFIQEAGVLSLYSETGNIQNGFSVSSAGDVNGDGLDDVLIGSPSNTNQLQDRCYVVFGRANMGPGGSLTLTSLSGDKGVRINGTQFFERVGISVSSAGDFNNDGIDDIILGSVQGGNFYVVFGSPDFGQIVPGDVNANGCVGAGDLAELLAAWGSSEADLNNDGVTDASDLAILLAAWSP